MVKACKMEATFMNSPFSAKYRPGHILEACILHQQQYPATTRNRRLPPAKAKDERRGVRCAGEIELAIAYEAFGAEFVGILIQFRIMCAGPDD